MPIVWPANSKRMELQAEWERPEWTSGAQNTGFRGKRPYEYRAFPKMVYKAQRHPRSGKWTAHDPTDEGFSAKCQLIVENESQLERAQADGYCSSPKEAELWAIDNQKERSAQEAHRHYEERNLSEKAKADLETREDHESPEFEPEVPALPLPPKPDQVVTAAEAVAKWSTKEERNARILELRSEGKTLAQTAKAVGVSVGTVTNVLKKAG